MQTAEFGQQMKQRNAIEGTHSDVDATLSGDLAALAEACTDDCVRLQQGSEADVAKHATIAANERSKAAHPGAHVLSWSH